MKKDVISQCPVCKNDLTITKLHCDQCHIEISGDFKLSRLSYLSHEQLLFVELFLKTHGNIKAIEKEMGISYPTVKKMLSDILLALGFDGDAEYHNDNFERALTRQEILQQLSEGDITFEESVELLKKLK